MVFSHLQQTEELYGVSCVSDVTIRLTLISVLILIESDQFLIEIGGWS